MAFLLPLDSFFTIFNNMITFKEYSELVPVLNQWAEAYAAGNPIVEDNVYDKEYIKLKEFEAANPDFILDDSPTRHVIDGASGFRKVKHEIPMISIANSNGIDEAVEWARSMFSKGVKELELEYKLDGLGLANIYKEGLFVDAVTRGTDNVGDSVWENALQIPSIPNHVDISETFEVRGEVVWKYDDFEEFNESLIEDGKKTLSNPRNGATGTLKLHDPAEVGRRKLSFIAYIIAQGTDSTKQSEDIELLENLGFEVPPHYVVDNIDDFVKYAEKMRAERFEQPYAIDGVVIKVNDKTMHAQFGYTAKTPNFYRAYKFPPEEKATKLIDIEQSAGMSGAITPVAILEPVHLAMTTVQRCTLHNWDLVEYLGLHKGCTVIVRKAGEIIPEIVKCVETGRSKDDFEVLRTKKAETPRFSDGSDKEFYNRPAVCPYCGSPLHNATNEAGDTLVAWVCDNDDCQAQVVGKLSNFVARTTMNIRGIGASLIQSLVDAGKINDVTDIYRLTENDLLGIGNIREKSAAKLIGAINVSRGNYLHQLIEGLSIAGVGHQASPVIANILGKLGGMDCFATIGDKLSIDVFRKECETAGISNLIAEKVITWFCAHSDMIRYFVENNIAQNVKTVAPTSAKLVGKVCIMTGTFDALERDKFKEMVVANGGTICSGITKKTNLVLLGDNAGPKKIQAIDSLKKAGQQIDIYTTDTLADFLALLE